MGFAWLLGGLEWKTEFYFVSKTSMEKLFFSQKCMCVGRLFQTQEEAWEIIWRQGITEIIFLGWVGEANKENRMIASSVPFLRE